MPQLLGLVLIGAGAFAGFKVAKRALGRMSAEHRARTQAPDAMKDIGALEFDPISGVYKPKKH